MRNRYDTSRAHTTNTNITSTKTDIADTFKLVKINIFNDILQLFPNSLTLTREHPLQHVGIVGG